ncbi:MAG: RnfABCDGE type electron transport complex subunit D [Ruminococcus sp.]|nr:RnfABCDGE type electron transport complex subunit D [Ruminococcus sp.]
MQKKAKTQRLIWLDVMITLTALELMAVFGYGARALILAVVCMAVSLVAELVSLRMMKRRFTADDLSCISDGLLIALMMPAVIDFRIPTIACLVAVIIAKNIFGGRHNMIFSPVAVAYIFVLTSWGKELLSYSQPYSRIDLMSESAELVHSASYTLNTTGILSASDFEILMGNLAGPMGGMCILLLAVSAVVLLFRRDISFGAFTGVIAGTVIMCIICPLSGDAIQSLKYVLSTNMVLFASVYIISDTRIAPERNYLAFFYGLFIAFASYVVLITTGQENVMIIMSVLFTPVALGMKNLEKRIADADTPVQEEASQSSDGEEIAPVQEVQPEEQTADEITETAIAEISAIAEGGLTEEEELSEEENADESCENVELKTEDPCVTSEELMDVEETETSFDEYEEENTEYSAENTAEVFEEESEVNGNEE